MSSVGDNVSSVRKMSTDGHTAIRTTCQKYHFLYNVLFPFSRTYLDRVSFEGNNINQQKRKRRNVPLELYFKKIYKRNAEGTRSSISFIVFYRTVPKQILSTNFHS